MKRTRFPLLFLLLFAGLTFLPRPAVHAQATLPLVQNFETLADGLPPGWANDSYGELQVNLAAETGRPKEGKAAWAVHVPAWYAGEARVKRDGIPLQANETYAIEVWLRGDDLGVPVTVGVAKAGHPETVYFARECGAGPQWRRFVLEGQAPTDEPNAELFISLRGGGSLYIDGLRMVREELPVEPAPPAPPVRPGNLVYNSSFELGLEGWTMPEQVALVKQDCPDGESFARWIPNPYPLQARPFYARYGATYVISAYLRSQRPGARVEVAAVEVGSGARFSSKFEVTGEWKRYAFSADLPCRAYPRYFLSFAPADEAHGFDVDAVQVEEGKVSEYTTPAVEVSTGLSRSMLFPKPDEIVGVPVQICARRKVPENATLRYRVEGFYGETLSLETAPIPAGKVRTEVPIRVRIPGKGFRRLIIDALVDRVPVSRAETNLTSLPPLDPNPRPDSFFGAHGSVGTNGEWHAPTVAARAGIRWWRLHDLSAFTQWAVAEPEQDRFVWYDREVDALRARGLSILGVFARTPAWAGQNPGGERTDPSAWPPAKIGDFGDYVREVTAHYKGRINAYELWNEPWAREFWAATPERYAELAKAGASAAKRVDPDVTLVGGSFWGGRPIFTDRVLAKGVAQAVDAVSQHQYTEPETVTYSFGGRDQVTQWYLGLRGKLNLVKAEKTEVWNTEGGTQCPSFYSWLGAEERARAASRTLAKTLILNKIAGVKRYFYYHVWQEVGAPRMFDWLLANNWSLLDYDGSPKPTLAALAACAQNLEGAQPFARCETPGLKAYIFKKGTGAVIAAWSPPALGTNRDLVLKLHPYRVRAQNLMGDNWGTSFTNGEQVTIPVRNEPIYIQVRETDAAVVAKAVKAASLDKIWSR